MSGGLADDFAAGAELAAAEYVAPADNNGELSAAFQHALGLAGDAQCLVNTDTAFAAGAKALAAQFEDDSLVFRLPSVGEGRIVHWPLRGGWNGSRAAIIGRCFGVGHSSCKPAGFDVRNETSYFHPMSQGC